METSSVPTTGTVASMELKTRRAQFQPQVSTLDARRRQAICVRRACKKYGPKSNPNVILDGLNMTVPKGAMYVLDTTDRVPIFRSLIRLIVKRSSLHILSRSSRRFIHLFVDPSSVDIK